MVHRYVCLDGAHKSVPGLHQTIAAERLWADCVFTICLRGVLQRDILEGLPHKPLKVFVIAQPRPFRTGKCILMGATWSREPDLASQQPLSPQCWPSTTQGWPWEHSDIFPSALGIHKRACEFTDETTLQAQLLYADYPSRLSSPRPSISDPAPSKRHGLPRILRTFAYALSSA